MRFRVHYGWIIVVVTFLVMLLAAGVRTVPSVVIKPLEAAFGWSRTGVSTASAISLFFYALGGPLAGTLVDRFGPKRVMVAGLGITVLGMLPMLAMREIWQYHLLMGVLVGIGTGMISNVLSATIAARWFNAHRGLVQGILVAGVAMGQLIMLPTLVELATPSHAAGRVLLLPAQVTPGGGLLTAWSWSTPILFMTVVVGVLIPPIFLFMRDQPSELGLEPVGGRLQAAASAEAKRFTPLRDALRTRDFWLLAGSFFVCGYTTNGLIGTHLLPHTIEHGFVEVETAGALGLMGMFNIVGTLISGWLSDRFDNRRLLATYYFLRGLSLLALPFITETRDLFLFAIVYGLDWVATVPPTVNLTAQRFGRGSIGTIYGWIFFSHMFGASIAAQAGGIFRDLLGDYHLIFISAALMGLLAAALSLRISIRGSAPVAGEAGPA